ncbi:hypothetical protein DPMN_125878 [Dreissena polymorpha]|uniref:Uncharacterized protein n=1 Tax=Dreissena polymorpha TaxID=45954 RepID=A0A9D4GVZ5_DREPO|nr:hypothetical protein DPMN_125878 [Dreissena polymorpha]
MNNGSPGQVVIDGCSRNCDPYGDEGTLNIDYLEADDIRAFEVFLTLSQFFHELHRDMCVLQIVENFLLVKLIFNGYAIHILNT